MLTFNLFSVCPSLLLNIGLSYRGFRQPCRWNKIPNFGYHFARWTGELRRKIYRAFLPRIVARTIRQPRLDSTGCLLLFRGEAIARAGPINSFLPAPCRSPQIVDGCFGRIVYETGASLSSRKSIPRSRFSPLQGSFQRTAEKGFVTSPTIQWANNSVLSCLSAGTVLLCISTPTSLFSGRGRYRRNAEGRKLQHYISRIAWITRSIAHFA